MHVTERLAQAITTRLSAAVPELAGRVFMNGGSGWDRRTYPVALVGVGRQKVDTQTTGRGFVPGRIQSRAVEIVIVVTDLCADPTATVASLTSKISAIEAGMAGFDDLPIDDMEIIEIGEVEEVALGAREPDLRGFRGTQPVTYAFLIHTLEGRPDVFLAEISG